MLFQSVRPALIFTLITAAAELLNKIQNIFTFLKYQLHCWIVEQNSTIQQCELLNKIQNIFTFLKYQLRGSHHSLLEFSSDIF